MLAGERRRSALVMHLLASSEALANELRLHLRE
jgi:hypothetical protein